MGRRSTGGWLKRGLAVAADLEAAFLHERDDLIARWAGEFDVRPELVRRWFEAAVYVRHWLPAKLLDQPRASLSTVEGLRTLESVDFKLASSLRNDVLTGAITDSRLREIATAAAEGRQDVPDRVRRASRDGILEAALGFCEVQSPETLSAAGPSVGYGAMSWIGGQIGLDAEVADERLAHPDIDERVHQFALVVSPEIACAVNVGRPPGRVVDAVWKAALVYNEIVYAAASDREIEMLRSLNARMHGRLDGVHLLRPVASGRDGMVTWTDVPAGSHAGDVDRPHLVKQAHGRVLRRPSNANAMSLITARIRSAP